MRYKIKGPKGGTIAKAATAAALPGLVKRYGRLTISAAAAAVKRKPAPRSSPEIRRKIVAYCQWGVANEPRIHYKQSRPIPLAKRRLLPLETDCSGFSTCAYLDAGAPDPNGRAFSGLGYTGDQMNHGRLIPLHAAKAGDLVFFGPEPGHHVVILLEAGNVNNGDPLVCSHGQERGPLTIRLSAEAKYQPAPFTVRTYL